MKLLSCTIRNFRRLECVSIDFETDETVFVGPKAKRLDTHTL